MQVEFVIGTQGLKRGLGLFRDRVWFISDNHQAQAIESQAVSFLLAHGSQGWNAVCQGVMINTLCDIDEQPMADIDAKSPGIVLAQGRFVLTVYIRKYLSRAIAAQDFSGESLNSLIAWYHGLVPSL
jgi:hypothetical protein